MTITMLAIGAIVLACGPGPGPVTTTTASTTTTSSTVPPSTVPGCGNYTPTGLVLSDNPAAPGDTITVSGNGPVGFNISIKLVKVVGGTTVDYGTTPVAPNGTWAKAITLAPTIAPGQWNVKAVTVGCATAATVLLSIA